MVADGCWGGRLNSSWLESEKKSSKKLTLIGIISLVIILGMYVLPSRSGVVLRVVVDVFIFVQPN